MRSRRFCCELFNRGVWTGHFLVGRGPVVGGLVVRPIGLRDCSAGRGFSGPPHQQIAERSHLLERDKCVPEELEEREETRDDLDRGVVRVSSAVPVSAVASVHVDDAEASEAVAAAATAITAADLGDESAQERVDDAEGFELSWYASQEIPSLLDAL